MRGYGGANNGAIGTLQQCAAPNIIGSFGATIYGAADMDDTGAFYKTLTNSYVLSAIDRPLKTYKHDFNAARCSAVYGRDSATEIRPNNYAIMFFIKY